MSYVVDFFIFNDLKWEVIVRFVDINGIVDIRDLAFVYNFYLKLGIIVYLFYLF